MKRTFIAVKVEVLDEFQAAISELKSGLIKENIKWTDISNMHVTLAFIGNTDELTVKNIVSLLENRFSGFDKIDFKIAGFGVFKKISDPRVIFSGLENFDKMTLAHETLKKGLKELDIKLEERKFNPHITIGRIKVLNDKKNLQDLIHKYSGIEFQNVTITEIVYYESILLTTGPVYKPILKVPLNQE
jgi:2'-5' RNA ligase